MLAPTFSRLYLPRLLLLLLLLLGTRAQAQLCGGGGKSLVVYVRNGDKVDDLRYEAFALTESALDSIQTNFRQNYKNEGISYCEGVIVSPALAHRLIRDKLIRLADFNNSAATGQLTNGQVSFETGPHGANLLLIRLYSYTIEAYVLGSFFCGCRSSIDILWEYKPRIGYRR